MTKRFDLGDIDTVKAANEGVEVELYHPATNEDLGIVITILGRDSDIFQKITRQQNKKRMDRMSKSGFRSGKLAPSPEEVEADGLELLSECTICWVTTDEEGARDTIPLEGEELPFSIENVKRVYSRFPWIKEQIDVAIGDRANFIKA